MKDRTVNPLLLEAGTGVVSGGIAGLVTRAVIASMPEPAESCGTFLCGVQQFIHALPPIVTPLAIGILVALGVTVALERRAAAMPWNWGRRNTF